MDKCQKCNNEIDNTEIYGDWFYCKYCKKELTYQPKRLNPEDAKQYAGTLADSLNWCDPTTSVCDSLNTANK